MNPDPCRTDSSRTTTPGACIRRNELLDVKDVVEYIKLQEASVHSMEAEPSLITVRALSAAH